MAVPATRLHQAKKRFSVETLTPKRGIEQVELPLQHLAIAARRHIKSRSFTDRSREPTDVGIVGIDLFGHVVDLENTHGQLATQLTQKNPDSKGIRVDEM